MKIKKKFDPAEFILDHIATLVFAVLVFGLYVYTMGHSFMFGGSFLLDLLKRVTAYLPIAIGVGCIMMVGGVDLSSGRIMGLTALVSAALLQGMEAQNRVFPDMASMPIATVFFIVIIIGIGISAINGVVVSTLKAPTFSITLGTQILLYGAMLIFLGKGTNNGMNIAYLASEYKDFVTGGGAVPAYVLIGIAITFVTWILITFTPFGGMMRAVGSDKEAAKKSGINVTLITLLAFIIAGAFYSYNGFVEAARVGGPGASCGSNAELDAVAACLMGGLSVKGGAGGIGGVVIGVILLQTISLCCQWMAISANAVYIIKGIVIFLAVVLDMLRWKFKKA